MRVSRYQRGYRFLPGTRAYLRDSILFAPLLGLALGSLLATIMINTEVALDSVDADELKSFAPELFKNLGQGSQAAIGTMASAMLTLSASSSPSRSWRSRWPRTSHRAWCASTSAARSRS